MLTYVKLERLWLKDHPEFTEKWVQQRIKESPSILGLGDLEMRGEERKQLRAGRLDLLLQDEEDRRYEVELQLGRTDESHIIRTIEYLVEERKRYPQYEHCGVIVAEDVTSRFLNVISLFNSSVPLIALQLAAYQFEDKVFLAFTKVVDELPRGPVDEDEEAREPVDRAVWEGKVGREILSMADRLVDELRKLDPRIELKYNKFYIGLAKDGLPDNFVDFRPKRNFIRLELRLTKTAELDGQLEEAGVDVMPYDTKWGKYRIRLTEGDLAKHRELISDLLRRAHENRSSP